MSAVLNTQEYDINEIKREISFTESESLELCQNLLSKCDELLLTAESYAQAVIKELNEIDKIKKTYENIFQDLLSAHKIIQNIYLCLFT